MDILNTMNPYLMYALLLTSCIPLYLLYIYLSARRSIVLKIGIYFLPTLFILCFTSYAFGITRNFLLFIPALGSLFVTFKFLTTRIRKPIAAIEKGFNQIAQGKLNISDISQLKENNDEFGLIVAHMESMTAKLNEVIGSIQSVTNNLIQYSDQLSGSSEQLSQGASIQASSTEEASASMEQITSNIIQNSENSGKAERYSVKAYEGIQAGVKSSLESASSMKTIAEKIMIINDIAFQTNILALNAAVEAARAGEHGKGFAVVAAEVRKLAEKSKQAADEISVLTKTGIVISEKAGEQLNTIAPDIESTATIVRELAASASEQRIGAEQINISLQLLSQETQKYSVSSQEIAANASELVHQAEELNLVLGYFTDDGKKTKGQYKSSGVKRVDNSQNQRINQGPVKYPAFSLNHSGQVEEEFEKF